MRNFIRHMVMAPAGEVSASNAPEVKANHQDLYENGDPNETFDNLEYESEASKQSGEQYKETFKERIEKAKKAKAAKDEAEDEDEESEEKPEKKAKEKKKEEPKKEEKKKSDIDTLSDKDADEEVDEEDAEEEEEDEKPAKKEESKDEDEEKALDKDKKGKLKVRMNGELYGLDADSLVRYKVDGEWVEKPLQEVLNKASGVEALDKRFSEFDKQKKEVEQTKSQVEKKAETLSKIVGEVVGIIKNPDANPMDAVLSLVEKAGGDVYTAERRLIEHCLETVEKLMGMNEAEVKAFWLEKKDSIRSKADESRQKAFEKEQALTRQIQELDAYRQTLGVSEDQFNEAWDELEAQGIIEKYTDKQVAEYASIKPHIASVQDVLEPFESQIADAKYEEIVRDFAKQLQSKKLSLEQLQKIAKQEFADEDLKDLGTRAKKVAKKEPSIEKREKKREYESFDDFE